MYAATRAFVTSFSELRDSGVKVTALRPGLKRTEFQSVSNVGERQSQFPKFMWTTAELVAETGLRDVARGRVISVPGGLYKLLVPASALLPRSAKRWIYVKALKRRCEFVSAHRVNKQGCRDPVNDQLGSAS